MVLPLMAEMIIYLLIAFLIGLGLAWLVWGKSRHVG